MYYHGLFVSFWGVVGVGLFCVVISICTELLCFGREAINCFWNIWVVLKRVYGGVRDPPGLAGY